MKPSVSLIIRSKNEEKTIKKTLKLISRQTLNPQEIILVDNESKDQTREIARKFDCQIITIKKFNHALACNLGAKAASGDLLVFTNAHVFPASNSWLEKGVRHFKDKKVAGVFGAAKPDARASLWEKLIYWLFFEKLFKKPKVVSHQRISFVFGGILGTDDCIIRRNLWEKHHFDEKLSERAGGGEDSEWAFHFLQKGFKIIEEQNFLVYHCHGDSLLKYLKRTFSYLTQYLSSYWQFKYQS